MLQGLERPNRSAELLARAQVIQRQLMQRIHRTNGFSGQRRDGFIHHAIHQRQAIAGIAQQRFGG